ncbi:succinate--CoA ligase subunit alpha [Methylococcus capsulatus]|jgi:succinyl-CoA synthetase alpha subunit/malate-CoA ligase subunit alpha|uniref:Succinate--CoA ligase [ADP-forming] subunit alpha n=2 Tax=Methylococcus capsulatus TaxID=414 RepID=Q607L8_METCA|nr:succinate--CoA ligase subunit alpha [Methylococcus capsulatus]AVA07551.1 succinate-CoA ligase [synthetic construct]AAU91975.1 succinyl-CoA synthase, alpha subunit [Methylococcus capsulatus str. Bath]QXP87605.1 succinate--CoA ligase subunit alpha [Methylococcus capsulatus]QXP92655.1 succinate--CoA ligase subunit alpha [Methylococcus capsulatus]UQN12621.1 succinate--CoA ligase subunit alpha [Methylococcus capsulatus]
MSVFVNKHSKVIFQGFTGEHATFHAKDAMRMGTRVVGGVTPGKGGTRHPDPELAHLPVFDTVAEAVAATGADVSAVFVPPPFNADALMEAIDAGIRVAVTIADGIPVHDMIRLQRYRVGKDSIVIGPNTPGIITPGECKVGIMPSHIYKKGNVGIVSRSGTLNYEATEQMAALGLGITTSVGIGGDPINGTDFVTVLRAFEADPETEIVVMIGEIGGPQEVAAARWAKENMTKPVIGFVAGLAAPTGRRMGHAGAIISSEADTAGAKMDAMEALGLYVARNPAQIGQTVLRAAQEHGIRF